MINQGIESGVLRVMFQWRGDRYGHTIERRIDGEWQPVLESVEGSPDGNWPPSPPLQTLHTEDRSSGPVALLVGMAGKSHWSASVEALPKQAVFQFDIACRVQHPPTHLGSAYRSTACRANPTPNIAATGEQAVCELAVNEELPSWHIRPVEVAREFPSTIRWRYTIALDQPVLAQIQPTAQ